MAETSVKFIPNFRRVWANVIETLKTSTLAVGIGFGIPIGSFVLNVVHDLVNRKPGVTTEMVLTGSFLSWSTLVPTGITILAWVYLIVRSYITTIRADEGILSDLLVEKDGRIEAAEKEVIATKRDLCDALESAIRRQQELVSLRNDLCQARATAEDNSRAFSAQYAENSRLRSEMDRFKSNRVKEEWLRMEEKFAEYGGGSNMDIEAFWERQAASGKIVWSLLCGWDEPARKRFWHVMSEAGQVLLGSAYVQSKYSKEITEEDDAVRWLSVLCAELDEPMTVTGRGYTKETGNIESGAVETLPRKCALCCAAFAAQEKWPAPKTE